MASPNFDALSVSLSHLINDPAATASTNGDTITSIYRTKFLNDGIRECLKKWLSEQNWMALRFYIKDGTATLSANIALLTAWTGTVWEILSAKNNTDSKIILPAPENIKYEMMDGVNIYLTPTIDKQYYVKDAGYFRLLDGKTDTADVIYLRYIKEHTDLSVAAGASAPVYDASFTYTVATLTITNFTGVITTHVGGKLVGTDAGGNLFERLITGYVSSTSFTIDSALTNAGTACTLGYIIPPSQNDIEIDSQYWDEVLQSAYRIYLKRSPTTQNIEALKIAG
jgi:hypothetical protein